MTGKSSRKFIIALPTFNEVESIGKLAERIRAIDRPFFVIDANSSDGTKEFCESENIEIFQRGKYGKGYGSGIKEAMEIAEDKGFEFMAFMDCDNTYPPEELHLLSDYLPEFDLIVGSRDFSSIPVLRKFGNIVHTTFLKVLFGKGIKDVNSGMRIVRIQHFVKSLDADHFGFVAQMSAFALKNDLKYIEVPITYGERLGFSKLKLSDGIGIMKRILQEKLKNKQV